MSKGIYLSPKYYNEKIKKYATGSKERIELKKIYNKMYNKIIEIPQYIGSEKIFSIKRKSISPPHKYKKIIAYWHKGNKKDVIKAIDTALSLRKKWSNLSWYNRASIFLKAADLLSGPYRLKINAATMIGQSKNIFQAEIDSACELVDFLRFNVKYLENIYKNQPFSPKGVWNRLEYRPLEGFVFAITPFNFTAIAGNLPSCMALMGNVVIWKPSNKQIYSANILMKIFKKAGLPDGVINMVLTNGKMTSNIILKHPEFSGIHFTGSTKVFKKIWKKIGNNIFKYKNYPRIVGETGGKNFIWIHNSACIKEVYTAILRGAFEYQGQKCSAVSRVYVPESLWENIKNNLIINIKNMKIGSPKNNKNFITSVIDKKSFYKIKKYIERVKKSYEAKIIIGGVCNKFKGYFIQPTIIQTTNPYYESMIDEIFGPILTIYVYKDIEWKKSLKLVNNTSIYALTGSIFSRDRFIIEKATKYLINCAGNFYINDKPTGAIVGQQPFGGSRASGTNDKAGSEINLLRWVSLRTIKETFVYDNKL